jgi:hypothetical protein
MNERRWERVGAEAGIAFVVLVMIGIFLPGKQPAQNASGQTLMNYINDHRTSLRWSVVLFGLGTVCALAFFATLRARMSEAEGGHSELATAAVIGGVFATMANMVGGLVWCLSFFRADTGLSPSTVRSMWDANVIGGMFGNAGIAVLMGAVAVVVLSTGLLPRWVGWLSAAVGVVSVVALFGVVSPTGAVGPGGAIGLISAMAGLLAVLAISIELLMHAEATAPAASAAPMPA